MMGLTSGQIYQLFYCPPSISLYWIIYYFELFFFDKVSYKKARQQDNF